jgi:GTP-binding protein Era
VALAGAPNVGKSSIVNALMREKVVAVSSKPQTTRNAVRCVLTTEDAQLVIIDTPGGHKPMHALDEFMDAEITSALAYVDAICLVFDASRGVGPDDEEICRRAVASGGPIVLAINKVDKLSDKEDFWRFLSVAQGMARPSAVIPVSALNGLNIDVLTGELSSRMPEGGPIYPDDVLMDATERFLVEETLRERILEATEQEVPHCVAVVVEEFLSPEEYPELKRARIRADVIVERPGQKNILLGERGSKLQAIRMGAKLELERRLGYPISLGLWVKVRPQWRSSQEGIRMAGYSHHR